MSLLHLWEVHSLPQVPFCYQHSFPQREACSCLPGCLAEVFPRFPVTSSLQSLDKFNPVYSTRRGGYIYIEQYPNESPAAKLNIPKTVNWRFSCWSPNMTMKGARIPPKRAPTVTKPMAEGLRVVGKISELHIYIWVKIYLLGSLTCECKQRQSWLQDWACQEERGKEQ